MLASLRPYLLLLVAVALASCSPRHDHDIDSNVAADRAAIDSLMAGRGDFYHRYFETEKREALARGDSDRWIECIMQEGVGAFYAADPNALLAKSDSAIAWLAARPETPRRASILHRAYMTKGAYYSQYAFNVDSTIHYHSLGVEYAHRSRIGEDYVMAMGNLADSYKLNTLLPEASDYYHRAIHVADSIGMQPKDYIPLYGGLAATYTQLRDFEQSREWWDRTMKLWDLMIPFEKFNNLNNLGNDYFYREDYPGALRIFKRLNAYLDSLPQAEWERNFVAVNMADVYLYLNHPDSAAPLIESTLEYFSTVQPNPVTLSYIHTLMMRHYMEKRNYAAVEHLIDLYPYSDTLRAEQKLARLKVMTDYYTGTDQWREGFRTNRLYQDLEDTLRSERVVQMATARRLQYNHDTEMLRLRAEKQAGSARILRLSLIIFLAVVVIAALAVGMAVMRARARRRDERMHSDMIALRMQSVRTRMTPHFIFNALNHEVLARQKGAPSHLKSLVSLLRHQQYVSDQLITPLSEELDFVQDYVTVQRDTIEGPFLYQTDVEPSIDPSTTLGPSMTIQIMVENAFKHGFRLMAPEAEKRLVVDVRTSDEGAHVATVFGNYASTLSPTPSNGRRKGGGTGLKIIAQTLTFINSRTGSDMTFDLQSGRHPIFGEGTWSVLTIPAGTDFSSLAHSPTGEDPRP